MGAEQEEVGSDTGLTERHGPVHRNPDLGRRDHVVERDARNTLGDGIQELAGVALIPMEVAFPVV